MLIRKTAKVGPLEQDEYGPLLRLGPGEYLYKVAATPWLRTAEGPPIVFRVLTKVRRDGRLEVFHFSQREGGRRVVAMHAVIPELAYPRVMASIQLTVFRFFPGAELLEKDGRTFRPGARLEGLHYERPPS